MQRFFYRRIKKNIDIVLFEEMEANKNKTLATVVEVRCDACLHDARHMPH